MTFGKFDKDGNWKEYAPGIPTEWATAITSAFPKLVGKEVIHSAKKAEGVYDILCNNGSVLHRYKNMFPLTKYRADTNTLCLGTEVYFRGIQLTLPTELTGLTFLNVSLLGSTYYEDTDDYVEYSLNIRPECLSDTEFKQLADTYGLDLVSQNVCAILIKWSAGVTPWGELYLHTGDV